MLWETGINKHHPEQQIQILFEQVTCFRIYYWEIAGLRNEYWKFAIDRMMDWFTFLLLSAIFFSVSFSLSFFFVANKHWQIVSNLFSVFVNICSNDINNYFEYEYIINMILSIYVFHNLRAYSIKKWWNKLKKMKMRYNMDVCRIWRIYDKLATMCKRQMETQPRMTPLYAC